MFLIRLCLPINSCTCSLIPTNMFISLVSTRRDSRDISGVWVSSEIPGIVSVFSHNNTFAQAMTDVGMPEDWGVLSAELCACIFNQELIKSYR